MMFQWIPYEIENFSEKAKRIDLKESFSSEEGTNSDNIEESSKLITTSESFSPRGRCLAVITTNGTFDMENLIEALQSIKVNLIETNKTPATLLVFNEGNLDPMEQKRIIATVYPRPVLFPVVDFDSFPSNFDPTTEVENWFKRKKWGYQQMCRFWAYGIWMHEELYDNCDTYMRFDTDSCFSKPITKEYLPGLPSSSSAGTYAYVSNHLMRDLPMGTEGLHDLVQSYVGEYNISITNPDLYQKASRLEVFSTNFEVANVTWFRQEHVLAFLKRIVEEEQFGVFRKREFLSLLESCCFDQFVCRASSSFTGDRSSHIGVPRYS